MPILKPCPRCKSMMIYGPAYCATCAPAVRAEREAIREQNAQKRAAMYNRRRDPKYLAFYKSKDWKAQSRARLQYAGYRCEAHLAGCQGLAVEVHHRKPIQTPEGWDKRLEWDNLEAVCTSCHNGRHPEKLQREAEEGVIDMRTVKR